MRKACSLVIAPALLLALMSSGCASDSDRSVAEQNKALVLGWLEAVDAGRWEVYDELLASDYAHHGPTGDLDRDATRESAQQFYSAFPDMRHEIRDVIAEGDKVVVRYVNRGTHLGEFNGVAPTERPVSFGVMLIVRVSEGLVRDGWQEADLAGLMSQISG